MEQQNDLVSGKTLAKIGLALVLLGIVFLYRWGVEENLITEEARVGVGVTLSLAMLVAGWVVRDHRRLYSALLQGGGVAGLFVSAFAAHARYELTSTTAVFVQLVFVSTLAIGLALHQRLESLAVVGTIGALVAPKMVPGTIEFFPGDAGYVAMVLVAVGVLLYLHDWTVLYAAAAITAGVSIFVELVGILGEWSFTPGESLVAYGAALAALWGAPIARLIDGRSQNAEVAMLATTGVPIAAAAAAWLSWGAPATAEAGVVAFALAALMAAVYFAVRDNEPFIAILHLLPASVFSLSGVALFFDGPSLILALAAQGIGFALIGRALSIKPMEGIGWFLYATIAIRTLFVIVTETSLATPVFNGDALAAIGVIAIAGVVGLRMRTWDDEYAADASLVLMGYAHIGFLAWSIGELARTAIGQPAASAAWGVYSLLIVAVAWDRSRVARNVGLGTLLLTVGKVFLVDLDNASGGAKILLLMGFGLALLALGYLMPSDDESEEPEIDNEPLEEAPLSHV